MDGRARPLRGKAQTSRRKSFQVYNIFRPNARRRCPSPSIPRGRMTQASSLNPPGGEFGFIDWLRRRTPPAERVLIGPGDDTAALDAAGLGPLLVTTDMLLEGSCFLLAEAGAHRVGRKAMAVNLSDIAAMAGRPLAAVVSVGL